MCEDKFTCASEIHILNYEIDSVGWFVVMLFIALLLQVAANYVWIQSSQNSRELLQLPIEERGSFFEGKLRRSMLWTAVSTLIWIARITLVMGSNLYIFICVLIGNLIGVYYTQSTQKQDHRIRSTANDILVMLKRGRPESTCRDEIKCTVRKALRELRDAMDTLDQPTMNIEDSDTESQSLLAF